MVFIGGLVVMEGKQKPLLQELLGYRISPCFRPETYRVFSSFTSPPFPSSPSSLLLFLLLLLLSHKDHFLTIKDLHHSWTLLVWFSIWQLHKAVHTCWIDISVRTGHSGKSMILFVSSIISLEVRNNLNGGNNARNLGIRKQSCFEKAELNNNLNFGILL